jgi:hypothetical protein
MKKTSAETAKAIRQELKKEFPNIKFWITSKTYTGGSSVDIEYIDAIKSDRVEDIVKKYEYGHFDGSQDLYEFSNYRDDIPQVRFVFVKRNFSDFRKKETEEKLIKQYGVQNMEELERKLGFWRQQIVFQELNKMEF